VRTAARPTRPRLLLTAGLGAVLALGGCSVEPSDAPVPSTQAADVAVDKVSPPQPVVPPTWPLTGVAAADVVNRPALAVKIENPAEVRPQTGLDQADVVWEQVVEGGITRFVAVFQSVVPDVIGPIRSVRPMDPAIAAPLHGVMAFSGGQPRYVQALADAGLQIVSNDAGDAGFYRTRDRGAPHNVFGTPATFLSQADAEHQASPAKQFQIARRPELATAPVAGAPAGVVNLTLSRLSQPSWTWDPPTGTWLRSESGRPATGKSGTRLAATNVVVVRVDLVDSGTTDPAGNPVPETKLSGTGVALVATGGKTVAATWTKSDLATPLALTGPDGKPVQLAPGKTWVELVPNGTGSVTVG
jgi:hypothetical protein